MSTIMIALAAWLAGGVLFAASALNNPNASPAVAETSRETLAGIKRCEPAALVALGLFVLVWPVIFVSLHLNKRQS